MLVLCNQAGTSVGHKVEDTPRVMKNPALYHVKFKYLSFT